MRVQPSYRYVILGSCFLATFSVWGVRYVLSMVIDPLVMEKGISYGQASLAASVFMFASGLAQPVVGFLVDRFGSRWCITAGVFGVGVALAGTAAASQAWHVYAALGVLAGVAFSFAGTGAMASLISLWFKQRGSAISANNLGLQLAQLLFAPAAGLLFLRLGLNTTLLIIGAVLALVVAPLVAIALAPSPPADPVAPGAGPPVALPGTPGTKDTVATTTSPVAVYYRRAEFWFLMGGLSSCGFAMAMAMTHLPGMFLRAGAAPVLVATSLMLVGVPGIIGQVLAGWLSDRWGRGQVLAIVYALRAVATVVVALYPTVPVLIGYAVYFGLLGMGTISVTSAACGDAFGQRNIGKTFGWIYLAHQMFAMVGIWLAGWSVDLTGSYALALYPAAVFSLFGAISSAAIPWQASRRRAAAGLKLQMART